MPYINNDLRFLHFIPDDTLFERLEASSDFELRKMNTQVRFPPLRLVQSWRYWDQTCTRWSSKYRCYSFILISLGWRLEGQVMQSPPLRMNLLKSFVCLTLTFARWRLESSLGRSEWKSFACPAQGIDSSQVCEGHMAVNIKIRPWHVQT